MVNLPQKTLVLWRARLSVGFLLLCAAFTPFFIFALPILLVFYLLMFFWYLPALFKSFEITLDSQKLIMRYGVLLCRQRVCFFNGVPVIYAFSTPLARIWRLELAFMRSTYGLILLPDCEYGRWTDYV